jgi:hypothetical protein
MNPELSLRSDLLHILIRGTLSRCLSYVWQSVYQYYRRCAICPAHVGKIQHASWGFQAFTLVYAKITLAQ